MPYGFRFDLDFRIVSVTVFFGEMRCKQTGNPTCNIFIYSMIRLKIMFGKLLQFCFKLIANFQLPSIMGINPLSRLGSRPSRKPPGAPEVTTLAVGRWVEKKGRTHGAVPSVKFRVEHRRVTSRRLSIDTTCNKYK